MKEEATEQDNQSGGKRIPTAIFSGVLELDEAELPCYVLDDGRRVFSTRGVLKSLTYSEAGKARQFMENKSIMPYLKGNGEPNSSRGKDIELITFDTGASGFASTAQGLDVEQFMDICHAYSEAFDAGVLPTGKQEEVARRANAIIRASSKIGIIALVDEATGYQYIRKEDELQFKLKLYLAEEMRGWERTFPSELWIEWARLTDWSGDPTKNRPRYWGYLVMSLIYQYLDPDVAKYIKENKPKPRKGQNYHQWFNDDYGAKKLVEHINRVIGMSQGCDTMDELKKKMEHVYGGKPLQLELFMEKPAAAHEEPLKIKGNFDDAMGSIAKAGK